MGTTAITLRHTGDLDTMRWRMAESILIVEDDRNIGDLVRQYLERDGYQVTWVRSGEEGLAELRRQPRSLVVLDVGLPGIDGFEVCRRIRALGETPVIMLTARDEEVDRVLGLELGADDYVPKPFSPRELVARMRAVRRRYRPAPRQGAQGSGRNLEIQRDDARIPDREHRAHRAGRRWGDRVLPDNDLLRLDAGRVHEDQGVQFDRRDARLLVAERDGHLLGFAQVGLQVPQGQVPASRPAELERLYAEKEAALG